MSYTYQQLNSLLDGKEQKVLKRNLRTWIERHEDHIGIHLVETEIMRYYPDGTIVLDSGGWQTATTKQRMNEYLPMPWRIWQKDGLWMLSYCYPFDGTWHDDDYGFQDGITIRPDGLVENYSEHADEKELKRKLDKYVTGFVNALAKGKVPAPSGGDCWDCSMRIVGDGLGTVPGQAEPIEIGTLSEDGFTTAPYNKIGQTRGEANGNGHLLRHFEEKYYVPSLLERAIEQHGLHDCMSQMALWWVQEKWYGHEPLGSNHPIFTRQDPLSEKQVRNCLKKYLKKQLGLPF